MSLRSLPDEVLVLVHDFLSAAQSPRVYCAVHDAGGAFRCTGTLVCDAVLRAAHTLNGRTVPTCRCLSVHETLHAPLRLSGSTSYTVRGVTLGGRTPTFEPRRVCVRHDCCRGDNNACSPDPREQLRALLSLSAQLQEERLVGRLRLRFSSWKELSYFTEVLKRARVSLQEYTPYVSRVPGRLGIRVTWVPDPHLRVDAGRQWVRLLEEGL